MGILWRIPREFKHIYIQTDRQTDRKTDRQADKFRHADRQADTQTEQTDRQTVSQRSPGEESRYSQTQRLTDRHKTQR